MSDFKCISCGEIKQAQKSCGCPLCGYKMFEMPYNRRDVLLSEIRDFIKHLEFVDAVPEMIYYYRLDSKNKSNPENEFDVVLKEEDDQRFPSFEKIRNYVCSAKRTELFKEYLDTTIHQIRKHIHESYSQEYHVNLERIELRIKELYPILKNAIESLGIKIQITKPKLPDIKLEYSETPNEQLIYIADNLLNELDKLSLKIVKFIKQNNIYGNVYKRKTKVTFKATNDHSPVDVLNRLLQKASKINAKRYTVDIFSDGSAEIDEMLGILWNAFSAILTLPVLKQSWLFTFDDGATASDENICIILQEKLRDRYAEINAIIDSSVFLAEHDDKTVFEYYDKMIKLDSLGFMGINKDKLIIVGESENRLNKLIGLASVKESIKKIKAYAMANRDNDTLNVHMCFLGNPGTGKTEVARYIAGILYENRILPTNKVIEVDRSGLVSQYFGATAEKTQSVIQKAMGGVLFVDEAYALGNNSDTGITDYGKEAIDTLVKAMEDHRGKFCVIFAGYKNEMLQMLSTNPGFKSRIQFVLDFPNYSRDELKSITELMLRDRLYTISEAALNKILDITDVKRKEPNFANAREIRNILDQVILCQNIRCAGSDDKELGIVDVNKYIQDTGINLPTSGDGLEKRILTGDEELDRLVGLSSVKRMIKKIRAYAKRNKGESDFNLHMCFYGNPGTGKTEVARILSRILYDAGVLDEAKLVETDGHGLLGRFVGETAPKTQARINEAMGGVLFIDEAYTLTGTAATDGAAANFADEAVSVLLKEMEDHRGRFCVILAGYKNDMQTMIRMNPGFESRIQFTLEFPDYTRDELREIAKSFVLKKKYIIENSALERILDVTDYFRNRPNFANARTVRNILDQVIMNQNLRTEDTDGDNTIIKDDVESYLMDEGIDIDNPSDGKQTIGFV